MPYYRHVGDVPAKRHTHHFQADGTRYAEELMGTDGFSSNSALLYHRYSPSALRSIEPLDQLSPTATADLPLTPRHLRPPELPIGDDLVLGRHVLLANDDVSIAFVTATGTSPLYRNATGDELVYVHQGDAVMESIFGALRVGPGDYVVVPAGATHRWVADGEVSLLVVAASSHVTVPDRYLSSTGQFLEHAPFCERDLRGPTEPLLMDGEDVPVIVANRAGRSRHVHRHHPFDVAGWDGCLYPWALNVRDFEPIVGSIHQPPPVHQTFAGRGFVVCSFVPRLFDFHPDAVKVPYHHANVDSDEVLFYAEGNFMSRAGSGIDVGSMSFHPAGFVHGPQPGSIEASLDATQTEEVAVMVDTFAPLRVTDTARSVSVDGYPFTWSR